MPPLGAHMSIAGGYYKAVEAASKAGCDCVQLFTKNNNQWRAKPITEAEVEQFRGSLKELGVKQPVSHASYLINLASPDDELWKKSIDAFVIELQRAEQLGIFGVVVHPGSYTTSSEEQGLKRIAKGLNEVHKQTRGIAAQCLLENTAGQGSNLGHRFEHLAAIIDQTRDPDRLGVCIDTCHAFAAGYAMETEKEFKATVRQLNQTVGLAKVKALHLNDSKKPLGSRVDRHEHIGR
ncbi:MAG: deoxyribonuclease IV, partial [Planctomycetales bacterium]|nr:deoxyribonuclease IV [Planctomycetales bacterium]